MQVSNFLSTYPASESLTPPEPGAIEAFTPYVHPCIVELWQGSGFGNYGDGLVQLIDPNLWNPILEKRLGRKDPTNTAFLMSGFGDLYFHRDLGVHEMEGQTFKVEDVTRLNILTGETHRVATDALKFFEEYLVDPEIRAREFKQAAFEAGLKEFGSLPFGEIFHLIDIQFEGAGESVINLEKFNALEYYADLA